jgi:hypothetical protein
MRSINWRIMWNHFVPTASSICGVKTEHSGLQPYGNPWNLYTRPCILMSETLDVAARHSKLIGSFSVSMFCTYSKLSGAEAYKSRRQFRNKSCHVRLHTMSDLMNSTWFITELTFAFWDCNIKTGSGNYQLAKWLRTEATYLKAKCTVLLSPALSFH